MMNIIKWKTERVNSSSFTIPYDYEILHPIGTGAFGNVVAARHSGQIVAVKKLIRPFYSLIHSKRTYRELVLLKTLNNPNASVVQLIDAYTPDASLESFESLYLVLNFIPSDLSKVLKTQIMTENQICIVTYSLLRALKYIHSAGIIHRDLKPSNIGIDEDLNVWILDFGLARQSSTDQMTGYVTTRWWRAPEIMFHWRNYDERVDIWSVGCILGEMLTGKPLFPGDDYMDQLNKIMTITGSPNDEEISCITEPCAREYLQNLPFTPKRKFQDMFTNASNEIIEVMERLLSFNPSKRPTAAESLLMPFFREYHLPNDEPVSDVVIKLEDASSLTIDQWKERTYKELMHFPKLHSTAVVSL
ncbi:hypothetical protein GJ496_002940 [Pomphorhynchus laevis]|nr:hypothetical protein GJ496_002940 [Pomphorhynchus laevis]